MPMEPFLRPIKNKRKNRLRRIISLIFFRTFAASISYMNKSIVFILSLILLSLGYIQSEKKVMPTAQAVFAQAVEELGDCVDGTTSFVSASPITASPWDYSYRTESSGNQRITTVLCSRHDYNESVHLLKFFKLSPQVRGVRLQSELVAQSQDKLPGFDHHSYRFADSQYIYSLGHILI